MKFSPNTIHALSSFVPNNRFSNPIIKKNLSEMEFKLDCIGISCFECPFKSRDGSCLLNIIGGDPSMISEEKAFLETIKYYKNNYAKEIVHEEMEI